MTNKRNILTIALVAISAIAFSFTLSSYNTKQTKLAAEVSGQAKAEKEKLLQQLMNDNYDQLWAKVDSLDRLGQPKSALEIVDKIYEKAKKEANPTQTVRALVYQNRYNAMLEEDGLVKAINRMSIQVDEAKFPVKPLLQSMLAEAYNGYFQNQQWKIRNRTETVNFDKTDIQTWSEADFVRKAIELYELSIEKEDELKAVDLKDFQDLMTNYESDGRKYRNTLYEFLAHRALTYFSNDRTYLTKPAYQFYVDKSEYFAEADAFSKLKIKTKDTESLKHKTMLLYQELIKIHLDDDDKSALIDVDLKRLDFVYNNYNGKGKDNFYEGTLVNMEKRYLNNPLSSEVSYKLAQLHLRKGGNYDRRKGDEHKWELKSAYTIASEAIRRHPKSLGATQCQTILNNLNQKEINLQFEQVNIPNKPMLGMIRYKNVAKVYGKIVKVTHEEVRELRGKGQKQWYEIVNLKPSVQTFSMDLKGNGDYRQHDMEFKLEGLDNGVYYVLVSDNADFTYEKHGVAYSIVHVSNLAFAQRKNEKDKTIFIITNRTTGEPQKGVEAEYFVEEYNRIQRKYIYKSVGKQTSDERGFINANVTASRYFKVKFSKGNDILYFNDGYSNYRYNNNRSANIQTHIFLDRAIYRPGQTIYFKGLAVKDLPNSKVPEIVKNEKVNVVFYDANYQEVAKQEFTTNEYGTFNGSFTAPQGGLLGQMRITVNIKGYTSSKYLKVEEYKRPKFEVTFNPIEGSFKLDEKVTIKGKGKAYAGSNIDGANVKYRVVRQAYFPYWRYWYWGYNPYNTKQTEIKNGETKTDENGEFTIDFKALADKSIPKDRTPFFNFTVYADVTDITGETHSSQTVVKVSYIGLEADIAVSEQVNKNETKAFKITTNNLSGTHENANGTVKVERLRTPETVFKSRLWEKPEFTNLATEGSGQAKAEFKKSFDYSFGEEDLTRNWEVIETVIDTKFNTENSKELDLKRIKNWQQGRYRLTMKTQDKFGNPIELVKEFTLFSPNEKTVPTNEAFWFTNDKSSAEPGETVNLQIGSGYKRSHVLYEVEQDGKIVESKWLNVKGKQSIDLPIKESYRGNIHYSIMTIQNGRFHSESQTVYVPWSNKDLKIEYMTFRDKMLPGSDEEWQIKISGAKGDKVAAEMVATMYDASLDAFAANSWSANFFGQSYQQRAITQGRGFSSVGSSLLQNNWQPQYTSISSRTYPALNWFGFTFYEYSYRYSRYESDGIVMEAMEEAPMVGSPAPTSAPRPKSRANRRKKESAAVPTEFSAEGETILNEVVVVNDAAVEQPEETDFSEVQVRTNLNETVFFYPDLVTDEEGNIIIKFKMNEALTRWKFLGFAHTTDLQHAFTQKEVVTQKDLMVMPNPPRFFRENDKIEFTAKVSNLSNKDLEGRAKLMLFDAITMQPIDAKLGNNIPEVDFSAKQGQSDAVSWKLNIPDFGVNAVTYRVVAKAGNFSDGEESTLPVLTNRKLMVETMPLPVRGGMTKEFTFGAMDKMNRSTTLKNHEMTLEFTSNPAWYAVQSLPYLMEYPYECTEQIFSRYYANTLATSVANSSPQVKKVFDSWKNITPEALKSNLSKNEELKYALLEETPWVLAAQSEEQQKKNIGLLFDLNRMSNELDKALNKMEKRQSGNGGFTWFPGGRDSWYITQYIIEGMGHLNYLGAIGEKSGLSKKQSAGSMISKAVKYCDNELLNHYNELVRRSKEYKFDLKDDHLDNMAIHYLYARSFYLDIPIPKNVQVAFDYYEGQAEKYWLNKGMYSEGMIALALQRLDKPQIPALIVKSLKERSLNNEEMGMYWKYPSGYYWYQAPIETHSLMIEVFDEVANDAEAVDDLKTWLLKNRQTTHWKTTKATASAVYAMLLRGDNWLAETKEVEIYFGGNKFDQSKIKKEAGTGYFKHKFGKENITADMAKVKVVNPNNNPAWGAMYWQYFEDFDKIESFEDTPLKLKKQLFKEVMTDKGPVIKPVNENEKFKTGDKVVVRIELRVDRPMEYVHMKDARASGFEPINVMSQYKWQEGLGYYESTRDASTDFFISYLPKGTYVFEYPLRANLKGDFSNGVTTIQCMYAPEFTSHSEGVRVTI
ncbi:MAG: alpha-2-macroglobulin, partial [Saprospiraceae bacterium]